MLHQEILKRPETVVIEIVARWRSKAGNSMKVAFTEPFYTTYVYTQATYKNWIPQGRIDERTKESRQLVALSERQKA